MPSILSNLKSAREWVTPTLKSSAFLTRGVLTPEEFVRAGDELVYKCPTWSWESGDPSKRKKYLPKEKQYLVTRGVPCTSRVSSLENVVAVSQGSIGGGGDDDDDDDGDWLVSQVLTAEEQKKREEEALVEEFDILDGEGEVLEGGVGNLSLKDKNLGHKEQSATSQHQQEENNAVGGEGDDDDEYADMADFEDDNVMEDEAAVVTTTTKNTDTSKRSNNESSNHDNDNILKVRTYDLSLTYDKYYQTPRVWLMGYSDDGSSTPLTGEEMMQDVISDYAHRTVTIENHPHVSGPHASIHPCQHGKVMKVIVQNLTKGNTTGEERGGGDGSGSGEGSNKDGPTVEMYLFIFLKFVSSMIPTIAYDFTMDVSASTKK